MTTRRYRITVQGRSYDVEVGDVSQSPVTVTVDGVDYTVDLPGGAETARPQSPAPAPERPAEPPPRPAQRQAAPPRPAQPAAGGNEVRAVMPGRVLTVNIAPGDVVTQGQPLLVVESMKMENTVASPRDGTIGAVHVGEGDTVQHGQTLVEFE